MLLFVLRVDLLTADSWPHYVYKSNGIHRTSTREKKTCPSWRVTCPDTRATDLYRNMETVNERFLLNDLVLPRRRNFVEVPARINEPGNSNDR